MLPLHSPRKFTSSDLNSYLLCVCTHSVTFYRNLENCYHWSPAIIIFFPAQLKLLVFLLLLLIPMVHSQYNSQSDLIKMQVESYRSFYKKQTLMVFHCACNLVQLGSSSSSYINLIGAHCAWATSGLPSVSQMKTMLILVWGHLPLLSFCQEYSISNSNMVDLSLSFRSQLKYQDFGDISWPPKFFQYGLFLGCLNPISGSTCAF